MDGVVRGGYGEHDMVGLPWSVLSSLDWLAAGREGYTKYDYLQLLRLCVASVDVNIFKYFRVFIMDANAISAITRCLVCLHAIGRCVVLRGLTSQRSELG